MLTASRALRRAVEATVDRRIDDDGLRRLIADIDGDRFVTACMNNRISGLIQPRISSLEVLPDDVLEPMRHEYGHARFRHLRTLRALGDVTAALTVPHLVVKGPVLASHWYRDEGVRGYGDLDLVVRPDDLAAATAELEAIGFELVTRNWQAFVATEMAEVQLARDDDRIDLHWHLQPLGVLREEIPQSVDEWFEQAITVDVGPHSVSTLGTEHTLLHLALHGALSGGDALVYLTDLGAVVGAGVDWDRFARLVREVGAPGCIRGLLDRGVRTIGLDVPESALRAIPAPRGWSTVFGVVDELPRRASTMEYALRPRRLLMGGRRSWVRTAAAVGAFSASNLALRFGRTNPHAPGGALHYETRSGGAEGRQRYFAFVEAASHG